MSEAEVDQPLSAAQAELLELAYATGSKIPLDPHIKDRARSQEAIVLACLELDQPGMALRFTDQIPNWRRGFCLGAIAVYCADQGWQEDAQLLISAAEETVASAEDWRRDRIRAEIGKAYALLGQIDQANDANENAELSEQGKVSSTFARISPSEEFDAQMTLLARQIENAHFDLVRATLNAYVELYRNNFDDEPRRSLLEKTITDSWRPMPIFVRINLLTTMADIALDNHDRPVALQHINTADSMLTEFQWKLEDRLPLQSSVIERQYRAGKQAQAKQTADTLLTQFHEEKETIVNIWRARALRPLAEAYMAMDDPDSATLVYEMALNEGVVNPNSRPRAEDLAATCTSMALSEFAPDPRMMNHITQLHEALSPPW